MLRLSACTEGTRVKWKGLTAALKSPLSACLGSAFSAAATEACLNSSLAAADHADMGRALKETCRGPAAARKLLFHATACLPARTGKCGIGKGLQHPPGRVCTFQSVCGHCAEATALQVLL